MTLLSCFRNLWPFSRIPRPLQRHRFIGLASFTVFLAAFVLFLLVGLSLTILPSIYILKIVSVNTTIPVSDAATSLEFGVWGVCGESVLGTGECYGPQLGYTIPSDILSLVGLSQSVASAAEQALFTILVLHLVAAALSTVVLILSFFLHSHAVAIIALVAAILTGLVASAVLAVDVVLVVLVRNNINSLFSGAQFAVQFGNAVWMITAAVALTWIAVIMLSARSCYCLGVRRPKPEE